MVVCLVRRAAKRSAGVLGTHSVDAHILRLLITRSGSVPYTTQPSVVEVANKLPDELKLMLSTGEGAASESVCSGRFIAVAVSVPSFYRVIPSSTLKYVRRNQYDRCGLKRRGTKRFAAPSNEYNMYALQPATSLSLIVIVVVPVRCIPLLLRSCCLLLEERITIQRSILRQLSIGRSREQQRAEVSKDVLGSKSRMR